MKYKIEAGDKVKTVLHGELVKGTCTKVVPDDPAQLTHHFSFNDGTLIVMETSRVNREVVKIDEDLPESVVKRIKAKQPA